MADAEYGEKSKKKQNNTLPIYGNESTMNLNPLILVNIQGSNYFKVSLFKLKTYHEVVDEIYYQVKHLEPWERGSRSTAGQTGMCGSVRGVGAGGIVSSAYCLLYKLYTLRLTRKQVNGLLTHTDSPYIRGLGFMYIRYVIPPADLFSWYEDYLEDEEEIDVKAGGGQLITIGQLARQLLTKLDWFSTLFPRIPVPIQKQIEQNLSEYDRQHNSGNQGNAGMTKYQEQPAPSNRDFEREGPSTKFYHRESDRPREEYYREDYSRRYKEDDRRAYREHDDRGRASRVDEETYSERKAHKKSKKRTRSRSHDRERHSKDKEKERKKRDEEYYSRKKDGGSRSRERSSHKDKRKYDY